MACKEPELQSQMDEASNLFDEDEEDENGKMEIISDNVERKVHKFMMSLGSTVFIENHHLALL
jgi:hypothetical protein